jgi:hypothetical protein
LQELESGGNFGLHHPHQSSSSSGGVLGTNTNDLIKVSINDSFVILQEEKKKDEKNQKSHHGRNHKAKAPQIPIFQPIIEESLDSQLL